MGRPDVDRIRDDARERIAGRASMVLDGEPIEELAKAHERHAERLDAIVKSLQYVGRENHLGATSEGQAATHNIVVAVHDHERSVVNTIYEQADQARSIARALRQIQTDIAATESENRSQITAAGQ